MLNNGDHTRLNYSQFKTIYKERLPEYISLYLVSRMHFHCISEQ